MIWTPELVAQLRQLYDEDLPYSEIAYRFRRQGHNVSKNAMVGKGRRIGLPPRRKECVLSPAERQRRLRVRRKKDAQRKRERRHMDNNRPFRGSYAGNPTTPEAMGRKAARSGLLIDLDMDQCRWPVQTIGHATYLFCCEDAWPGKSYCPDHCNKSYGPNWIR